MRADNSRNSFDKNMKIVIKISPGERKNRSRKKVVNQFTLKTKSMILFFPSLYALVLLKIDMLTPWQIVATTHNLVLLWLQQKR